MLGGNFYEFLKQYSYRNKNIENFIILKIDICFTLTNSKLRDNFALYMAKFSKYLKNTILINYKQRSTKLMLREKYFCFKQEIFLMIPKVWRE